MAAIDLLDARSGNRAHRADLQAAAPQKSREQCLARVGRSPKPFTLCFLGAAPPELPANATAVPTLRAAAEDVLGTAIAATPEGGLPTPRPRAGLILGLYSGGTLAAEAQLILLAAGRAVASNAAVPGAQTLASTPAGADSIIDLGADEFTRGRPHPMIDPAVRSDRLSRALSDQRVAAVLLDVMLGFGAHPDPARDIAAVVARAPRDRPQVVASVTGTEADPQVRSRQVTALRAAGVLVAGSNAGAAELALLLAKG